MPGDDHRPALVGRDSELALLTARLEQARAGRGSALVVLGEAGIGKSRLLAELSERARASGDLVLIGGATSDGGTYRPVAAALAGALRGRPLPDAPALRPFRAALRSIAPGWSGEEPTGPPTGPGPDPAVVLGEGVIHLLTALGGDAGCLLVLEDLHWADGDTLALIRYLAGALSDTRILLAMTARDDEVGGASQIAAPDGVTAVTLHRLTPAATSALAAAYAGAGDLPPDALDRLLATAAGLPVLVQELVSASLEPGFDASAVAVPRTMAELVRRRLSSLPAGTRQVLSAAAVLGSDPDWSLLAAITETTEAAVTDGLRAATTAGLLVQDGARLSWRHALVGEAVLDALLPPERAALAREAAARIEERGAPADEARAAELFAVAGEPARSAAIFLRQSRREATRGALRSAEQLLDRAEATGSLSGAVAIARVDLLTLAGRGPDALALAPAALSLVTGDEHAQLCLQLARAGVSCGRWAEARQYVTRAGRPEDPRSGVLLAEAAFGQGDPAPAAALAQQAVQRAEALGLPDVLCAALLVAARCAMLSDIGSASSLFGRVAQLAAEHGLTSWRVDAVFGLGLCELMERESPGELGVAHELALDAGMLAPALSMQMILAEHAWIVDGPRSAEPLSRETAERSGALGLSGLQAMAELMAAGACGSSDDVAGMHALIDAATGRPHVPLEVAAIAAATRAFPALLEHDVTTADERLNRGLSQLTSHGSAAPLFLWGLWALVRVIAAGDEEPGRFVRDSGAGLRHTNRMSLAYADAILAGRQGRADDAAALFAAADARHVSGWLHRLQRLLVLRSAVIDGWGDPVPLLRADLTEFERRDEVRLARTCRDLLRRAGAPTRRGRGTSTVPPSLRARGVTSREIDVLELVGSGLSNPDIAARLFLSPRTVETHVTNLLTKTGSADRAALRRIWNGGSER